MARNPTTAETQLEINSTYNSSNILTVDGRYRVATASVDQITLSGCGTGTGNNTAIYFMTRTWYGYNTSTNIFNGSWDSRTFTTSSNRPLYQLNDNLNIYSTATNFGQAFNNGGSDYYYVYVAIIDSNGFGNFYLCSFTNSVSGVSSNYLTVTWNTAILTPTLQSGNTYYGNFSTSNTANTLESGNKVVLERNDTGYALDVNVGSTYSDIIYYATTYNSTTTAGVSSPFGTNVGRTFGFGGNASVSRLEPSTSTNRVTSLPTEGYYQLYRLWGRIYPGSSNPNTSNGKQYDGLYYQKGVTYTVYHPDTGVTVPSSTINIGASDTQANITVSNISSSDQNGYQWRYLGNSAGTRGAGSITPTSATIPIISRLPSAGTSRVYNLYVKMYSTNSNSTTLHTNWVDTGKTVTVSRPAASSYSVSASPTSVNEGQSTTWTITYSNISSARTVNYTIGGINSSDLSSGSVSGSISIGSGSSTRTVSVTFANDVATEGSETATLQLNSTDSAGTSTGSPSASVTIADTSNQGGSSGSSGTIGGGATENYGLKVSNVAGTSTIINNNSRVGTFIGAASITLSSTIVSGSLFTNSSNGGSVACSDNTTIGLTTQWTGSPWLHPDISRNASTGLSITRSSPTSSGNFYSGTLTVSLIRY
tara:strand:+ start:40 stop:1986 length:1947 start_codon:yes stop_codon:yes gene_type:complete